MTGLFFINGSDIQTGTIHNIVVEEICHMCETRWAVFYNCLQPFEGDLFEYDACMCVQEHFPSVDCSETPEDEPETPVDDDPETPVIDTPIVPIKTPYS